LGLCYMLRAAGDIGNETLSLISSLGLIHRTQPYIENHWWPVLVVALETAVLIAIAYALNAVRDMGQGLIPAKSGRRSASSALRSPFGLAFRLLRNPLFAWLAAMFMLGASYGSIQGDTLEQFIAESEFYQMMIGTNDTFSTAEMFTTMVNSIMALVCVVPALTAVLKLRSEEKEGRTEHVLARVVKREQYMAGYVGLGFVFAVLNQCATALGLYVSAMYVLPEPIALGFLMEANLVYLPAIWIMMGIAVLLTGWLPKATGAVWGYFGISFFAAFMGRILALPDWLMKITPFTYIPQLPADSVNYTTLALMTGIAVVLTVVGFVGYRERDTVAG